MGAEQLGQLMKGGVLRPIPPTARQDEVIAVLNEIVTRLNNGLHTQVLSDNTTRRFLFGFQEDGWGEGKSFGMKISMEGVDVTTATDDQLLFSMDMDRWRWFDPDNDRNFFLVGLKPDGTQGAQLAKPGESLT
jgi:hypothetical protein